MTVPFGLEGFTRVGGEYPWRQVGSRSLLVQANCLDWLAELPEESIHAVVCDPPYGVKEYEPGQIAKLEKGKGGSWRIPPSFDGHTRSPLPRFTDLNERERTALFDFFQRWSVQIARVLVPGAHVFVACNAFLVQPVSAAIVAGGLEFRGETMRLVRTLRGGDRPKGAEDEFPDVVSLPRGCYEPWPLFRKPIPPKMTVADTLRKYGTGALRRLPDGRPFSDVIPSERTPKSERSIANHPSLKPQSFLRQVVRASLPLGEGVLLDPFAGSGSTVAAAEALGLSAIGIERYPDYFLMAAEAIPKLALLDL